MPEASTCVMRIGDAVSFLSVTFSGALLDPTASSSNSSRTGEIVSVAPVRGTMLAVWPRLAAQMHSTTAAAHFLTDGPPPSDVLQKLHCRRERRLRLLRSQPRNRATSPSRGSAYRSQAS